ANGPHFHEVVSGHRPFGLGHEREWQQGDHCRAGDDRRNQYAWQSDASHDEPHRQLDQVVTARSRRLPPDVRWAYTSSLSKRPRPTASPHAHYPLRSLDMYYIIALIMDHSLGDFELAVLLSLSVLDDAYGASIRREVSERL